MKKVYTIKEVAEQLGCGRPNVYKHLNNGCLKAVKMGKRTLVLHEDLEKFLNSLPQYTA